jgi:hypothetical protein
MENLNKKSNYADDILEESEEINSREYLGTFRWKRSLKFPKLKEISFPIRSITKWGEYLENRIDFEIEPYIVDALSYPMSVIYILDFLQKNEKCFKLLKEKKINLILVGVSNKVEERIAMESNYFDEIFNYINSINPYLSQVNLYFVGQEIKSQSEYTSKLSEKLIYNFFKGTVGDFLKKKALELNKSNTFVIGLNCGFGAGFLKLSISWLKDLIVLLKFGYYLAFTYTNDYEDFKGESAIIKNLLQSEIKYHIEDNPFKSMTVYKKEIENNTENELWSCGNYGSYVVNGFNRENIASLIKLNDEKLKEMVKLQFLKVGITPID